jgi:Mrp family chromosome partitioning ATPase
MSIVERALQKAQAKARADGASVDQAPAAEPGPQSTAGTAPAGGAIERPESAPQAATRHTVDGASGTTSLDAKATVSLDMERLRAAGQLPSAEVAARTEDEIRRIKWPLLKAVMGGEGVKQARNNVILVTSAMPGEGKTFTSLSLALSIVRDREMSVMLVDGDVARPGLTPAIGLEGRPGLNDVLDDAALDVGDVTYQTDVDGLFFVPAGKWHAHAPEFLAGSRMPLVIEALSARIGRGVIIIDSPPLLATNEAQVATRYAGQVLLVVRADDTPQQAVLDAIALVDKDATVSAILNRCKPSVLDRYYGRYYYGSGSGYGHGYRGSYNTAQVGQQAKGDA